MKEQAIIAVAAVAGIGALIWLKNQPSLPASTPTLSNQDGSTVAFPTPAYTLPDPSNPAQQFAPYAYPSGSSSGVPAPVNTTTGGPTYLTYNFGDDGALQYPALAAIDQNSPPVNTTLGNVLKALRGIPQSGNNTNSACGCGCSGSSQNCSTCTNGGNGSLAASPVSFVQNVLNAIPNFVSQLTGNSVSSGLVTQNGTMTNSQNSNPFNGYHNNVIAGSELTQ